jgi:hypothetical protein
VKRPVWVSVTGALGVLFAVLGMLGAFQGLLFPRGFGAVDAAAETSSMDGASGPKSGQTTALARQVFDLRNWFKPLSPVSRTVGFLIAAFYLLASLRLMSMKRRGLRLFQWALLVSTLFHLLRASAAIASLSILGLALVGGSVFWLVVNGALLGVVRLNDCSVFQGE